MNTRDIEAAAEKWNNTLERLHNDPQPERPEPEPDYIPGLSFNLLLEENRNLLALVKLLKVECGFLHLAVKQKDEIIRKMTDEQDRAE
jgi:hypothetical protein